jgi:hypothetical protein
MQVRKHTHRVPLHNYLETHEIVSALNMECEFNFFLCGIFSKYFLLRYI